MFYKTNGFKLCAALLVGVIVFLLPRPEGTQFKITGDEGRVLMQNVNEHFVVVPEGEIKTESYILKAKAP
ncbi:MAG: anion transporter, partial [Desulfobacula sp.]|nr:anion transporter [Desulfobacula sp.]